MGEKMARQFEALNRLYKDLDQSYHALSVHFGLSDSAFWVLYILREKDVAISQTEVAQSLFTSKQTIHSTIKSLETDGYITLQPVEGNRKTKMLVLTQKGLELTARTVDKILAFEKQAFEQFDDEERLLFLKLNQRYVDCMKKEANKILKTPSEDLSSQ